MEHEVRAEVSVLEEEDEEDRNGVKIVEILRGRKSRALRRVILRVTAGVVVTAIVRTRVMRMKDRRRLVAQRYLSPGCLILWQQKQKEKRRREWELGYILQDN